MLKTALPCVTIAVCLVAVPQAQADFLLEPPAPTVQPPSTVAAAPMPLVPPSEAIVKTRLSPPATSIPVTRGYGHHVSLSFAVRQIVPPNINIIYANTVDRSETVNWQGGSAWTTILVHIVKPLGLRIRRQENSIEILPE